MNPSGSGSQTKSTKSSFVDGVKQYEKLYVHKTGLVIDCNQPHPLFRSVRTDLRRRPTIGFTILKNGGLAISRRLRLCHTGSNILRRGECQHRTEQSRSKEEQSHHGCNKVFLRGCSVRTRKREDRYESQLVHHPVTYVLLKICSDVTKHRAVMSFSFFMPVVPQWHILERSTR
jgi:hypothetical protein